MRLQDFDYIKSKGRASTLPEVIELVEAVRDGDVHHVDGLFIAALEDLAAGKSTLYAGVKITRHEDKFILCRPCWTTDQDGAVDALHEATRSNITGADLLERGWTFEATR